MFQTPLKLNAKAGDKILIMTDTAMDPLLWQGLATAANVPGHGARRDRDDAARAPRRQPGERRSCRARCDPEVDLVIYLTSTAMAHAPLTEDLVEAGKKFILMEELTVAMLKPRRSRLGRLRRDEPARA